MTDAKSPTGHTSAAAKTAPQSRENHGAIGYKLPAHKVAEKEVCNYAEDGGCPEREGQELIGGLLQGVTVG